MTNDEAVKDALDAVAKDFDEGARKLIASIRRDLELSRGIMPNDAFVFYEVIKRSRIEVVEHVAQLADWAIERQLQRMARSKR